MFARLFKAADLYLKQSDWKTIAALKFCLLSLGVIAGMLLPQSHKLSIIAVCVVIFLITYIPLMRKLLRILKAM
ncbi:MAG: permease of phosphate ABC transporter [Clostridia bacterium]|nr:permease of phosphate ABC transporter [Clostridia bacterium]